MAETIAGSPEVSAPAETSPTKAAPAAEVVPSTNTDFASRIASANNPLEVTRILEELRKQPAPPPAATKPEGAKPAEPKPAEAKTGEGEKPAEEAKPDGETATPEPAETAKPTEGDTETEAEPGDGADSDLPVTPLTAKRAHLRLPPETDQVGRLALGYLKRNRDWTLEQAMDAARNSLGVKPEPAKATTPEPAAEKQPGVFTTLEELDTETDRLESEKEKATTDLRFDDAAKLERQLRRLDRQRLDLVDQQRQQRAEEQTRAEATYNQQFDASHKRATELYDFATDPKSEGAQRMVEIEEALRQAGDPLYTSPNKPLVIAQMVARELRIPPKTAGAKGTAKAPATKPAAPAAPATAKPKSVLTEGGATTTPATSGSTSKFVEQVQSVKTLADFNKIADRLGILR